MHTVHDCGGVGGRLGPNIKSHTVYRLKLGQNSPGNKNKVITTALHCVIHMAQQYANYLLSTVQMNSFPWQVL